MTDTKAPHQVLVKKASRIAFQKGTVSTSIVVNRGVNTLSLHGVYKCSAGKTTLPFKRIDFAEQKRKAFYRHVNALLGGF